METNVNNNAIESVVDTIEDWSKIKKVIIQGKLELSKGLINVEEPVGLLVSVYFL